MYCTQCTSRQVLLMCTQRLGWGFVRPGRTHTHGCLHSHATCLTPHTLVHCHYSMHRHGWVYTFPRHGNAQECVASDMWRGNTDTHACVCVQDARIQDASLTFMTQFGVCMRDIYLRTL